MRCLERSVDSRDTCFQLAQRRGIGLGERLPLRVQPLASLRQRLGRPLQMRAVCLLELQAALGLHEQAARLGELLLRGAERLLRLGQARVFGFQFFLGRNYPLLGASGACGPHVQCLGKLRALLAPGDELRAALGVLALEARACLLCVAQLRFMARHLGVRGIERALRRVHRIARLVVRRARRLEPRFQVARLRVLGFELVGDTRHFGGMALALGTGVAPAQIPQEMLLELQVVLQLLVARRDLRLRVELLDLRAELQANVGDAREVLARVGEARLSLAAPFLVLGDARRLLEEHAQLLGLRLDHARDHALLDDGVSARAQPSAEEHVGDVAPAYVRAVDVVARLAVALQDALHRDFRVLRPLTRRAAE